MQKPVSCRGKKSNRLWKQKESRAIIMTTARVKAAALAAGQVEEASLREQLAVAQAQLAKTKIRAAVAGTVLTRDVEPGDLVQPGQTLFTIALTGNTEIRVPLDERNLPQLALQQNATVISDAYPDQSFPARINFIAPSIRPTARYGRSQVNCQSRTRFSASGHDGIGECRDGQTSPGTGYSK